MKSYYEDSVCTIYHGDCREILPALPKVDLVLTDPPYGVKGDQNSKRAQCYVSKKNNYGEFTDSVEYVKTVVIPVIMRCLSQSTRTILTPGNKCLTLYPQPDAFGCFYQPASIGLQSWGRANSQPIFYYGKYPYSSNLIPGQNLSWQLTESPPKIGHPCSKPIKAWTRLLVIGSRDSETVLDPFMGSGTTLRAAKDLGRKAIGIEIEEKYCEIAAKRLAQEVLPIYGKP